MSISVSVGIAVGLDISAEHLIRDAADALYAARHAGKNCWNVFRPDAQARNPASLPFELKDALTREQFFLLYQPIFTLEFSSSALRC